MKIPSGDVIEDVIDNVIYDVIHDAIDDAIDDVIDDVIDDSYLRDKCDPLSKKAGWWKFKLLQIDFDSICCWFFCIGCN